MYLQMHTRSLVACLVAAAVAAACGNDGDDTGGNSQTVPSGNVCAPGLSVACAGPNSCLGYQVCSPDGSKFEPCDCGVDASAGGAGASGGSGGNGGTAGSSGAGNGGIGGSGGSAGSGSPDGCNPAPGCWNKVKIGTGNLNKAFADKNGKLYVGHGATGYYTNATGTWVSRPLNSDKWALDENGNPHTVSAGAPLDWGTVSLVYSEFVAGSWTAENIPLVPDPGCPSEGAVAWDIYVEPNGSPHIAWNRMQVLCAVLPDYYVSHSYKQGGVWKSDSTGGQIEPNGTESKFVSAALDSAGHFYQAWVADSLRQPMLVSTNPSSVVGSMFAEGEISGQVVLAKPTGLPIHALFSGWWYDEFGPDPTLDSVILTEDVAAPKQPNAKTTLLSCPHEIAKSHTLAVSNAGVVRAAWVAKSTDAVRFATNATGAWAYNDLGTGTGVEIVVTPAGQVNVFLGQGGEIYHLTPCN